MKIKFVFLPLFIFFSSLLLNAQFEQKVTLNTSLGYFVPLEEEYYGGFSFDAGILYNFNRKVSLITNFRYISIWREDYYDDFFGSEDYLALGIGLKYNFNPEKRLNFYVLVEVDPEYVEYYDEDTWEIEDSYFTLGGYAAFGADYRITDNFGGFLQSGYCMFDFFYPNTIYTQLGIRFNFFKKKDL